MNDTGNVFKYTPYVYWQIDADGNAYNVQTGTIIAPFYDKTVGGYVAYMWFPQYDLYDNVSPINKPFKTLDEARLFICGYVEGYNDRTNEEEHCKCT